MRRWVSPLAMITIAIPCMAMAAQNELEIIARETSPADIARLRASCAVGRAPSDLDKVRSAGVQLPSAGAWCVAVLTRAGRDGTLGYVRDTRGGDPTSSIAFDGGFVGGYLKQDALPAGAPTMATLLPVADHCLAQQEPNTKLCSSVGYILGVRAAKGETVASR